MSEHRTQLTSYLFQNNKSLLKKFNKNEKIKLPNAFNYLMHYPDEKHLKSLKKKTNYDEFIINSYRCDGLYRTPKNVVIIHTFLEFHKRIF